jgi:flagellar motor protein MotB
MTILFFLLSGIVTLKALMLPVRNMSYEENQGAAGMRNTYPDLENMSNKFTGEQAANRALVEELQATINKLEDKLSEQEESQAVSEAERSEKKSRILAVLGSGSFQSGQVVISDELMSEVRSVVKDILESPDHRVFVEGHTDNAPIKASAEMLYRDNMDLSFMRAKAIARILEEQGISYDRISVIGYGDTRPIASNETYEGRARNRRVEVKLVPEDGES